MTTPIVIQIVIQIIGYLAMALLVLSFLFKNVVKLRVINTVACLFFVVYGLLLKAYPIAISNAIIIGINLYHLFFNKKK